jgi:hypothetical protein
MLHPWKKLYHDAMREPDPAKQKKIFARASKAIHEHALELTHELAELEEARRQLTVHEVETNNKLI